MSFHKDRPPCTTFVYQYTAREPVENLDVVKDQIWLAHRYYNKLVEIERARRDRYYEIVGQDAAVSAAREAEATAQQTYEAAAQADAEERKVSRRRTTSNSTKAALKDLKAKRRETKAAEREAAKGPLETELKASDERAKLEAKTARKESEVYWGTYLIVERSLPHEKAPPKFHRWDQGGQTAVQLQKGMTEEELLSGTDTRARLELREDWGTTRRASRYGTLWLRVSSEGRNPVWAKVPIFYDRRIPAGAKIKWIQLIRRRRGTHLHWFVSMTIEIPGAQLKAAKIDKPAKLKNAIALDLGWRKRPDGSIRVAYAYDGERSYEVTIPQWVLDGYELVHDLRSIRDTSFNGIRDRLVAYLRDNEIPDDLRERFSHLAQWRSTARLGAVVREWEEAPEWLEAWRKQDRHLYQWERDLERSLLNWRKDWYRHWALWVARRYDHVLVEDANLAEIKRHAIIGEDKVEAVGSHVPASPGELRQQIRETCAREGVPVHLVPSANTTKTCSVCGEVGLTRTEPLRVRCDSCGANHDQDCNASRIIHSYATKGKVADTAAPLSEPTEEWYRRISSIPKRVHERRQRLAAAAQERA